MYTMQKTFGVSGSNEPRVYRRFQASFRNAAPKVAQPGTDLTQPSVQTSKSQKVTGMASPMPNERVS